MKKYFINLVVAVFLIGCSSTSPIHNPNFIEVTALKQFIGKYENLGDRGENSTLLYLSALLWSNNIDIEHSEIDTIEVLQKTTKILQINALNHKKIVYSDLFVEGKHFYLSRGKVALGNESRVVGFKSGDPMIGLKIGSSYIGLNESNNIKFSSHMKVAGLVFLFFPIAMSDSQDVVFYRLEE